MSNSPSAPSACGEWYNEILRQYQRELRPQGVVENNMVECIAHESHFLRIIDKAIDLCLSNPTPPRRLSALLRYKSDSQRSLYRAFNNLLDFRKLRETAAPAAPGPRPARRAPRLRIAPFPSGAVG